MTIDKNMLLEKTLSLLEYRVIMERAAGYALSAEAADIIKDSKPLSDDSVIKTKEKVRAICDLKKTTENEPKDWLPSIGFLLPKIEVEGTVLDLDEVLAVGLFIERGIALLKWTKKELNSSASLRLCERQIFETIDKEGNLRDLPALRAIKRRIESLEKELKSAVSRYISDAEYSRMLQSPLPSQRDGRAVIAVKSNYKGRIKGIVHEASSSGQTIFIEPLDVVEKNNDLLIEKRNLDAEIQKILRELTEKISVYVYELKTLHSTVIELEILRAKAAYSAATKGHFAKDGNYLILKKARHPLIKNPVPINIEMSESINTLIITGPNTGGKTVALKTLGLFAMMNQSGLALPLEDSSSLPLFDGIYADIGDEQSINQSLSTFSAHIANISAITAVATEKSLVLLDELGSGTDPEEGGAIAMAILDYLIEKKSRMIVTTHHGILKHYGYTRQGVENASVEFNAETLSPTYKIINGLPGESRALDIAEGKGLNPEIVKKARKYIDEEQSDITDVIKELEQKQRELTGLQQKSEAELNKLKEEQREADLKELRLRQKEAELNRGHIGKLRELLDESRKTLENLVREVKEGELSREKTLKVKEFLNELANNVENESDSLDNEQREIRAAFHNMEHIDKTKAAAPVFSEGMEVFAGSGKQRGILVRKEKKGKWLVKTGSLKMIFSENDLLIAPPEKKTGKKQNSKVSWSAEIGTSGDVVYELMIRKMKYEDAMEAVRRQMEAAILTGLKHFSIIHGKGEGVLRKGVHDFLNNNPNVSQYFFARPELGGFGRTEVFLK